MNLSVAGNFGRIAIGTVQFGLRYGIGNVKGKVPPSEAKKILRYAESRGIDTLDTAVAYGDTEQRLGEIGVDGFRVVTKLPPVPDGCPNIMQWMTDVVDGCLERLRVPSLHGLLLHRPRQLLEPQGAELAEALQGTKNRGVVGKVGVSIYDPADLAELMGGFPIDLVQTPFSILDHRLVDSGWLARLDNLGVEVHVRSVFLQGLLLMDSDARPRMFDRWTPLWRAYGEWLETERLTPLQACLRYVSAFPGVSRIVVGVDCLEHLKEIEDAIDGPMPPLPDGLGVGDAALLHPANWSDPA